MVICPNCGEQYENPGKFCSKCGAPLESTEPITEASAPEAAPAVETAPAPEGTPPEPVKKNKKPIVIAAVVTAILLVAIAASVVLLGGLLKSPADKFVDIHQDAYLSPITTAVSSYVDAAASGDSGAASFSGDMTLSFNSQLDDYYYAEFNSILNALSIDLSADIDADGGLLGIGFNYEGETLLTGIVSGSKDSIGLQLPELDSNYYTMSLDAFYTLIEDMTGMSMNEGADELTGQLSGLSGKDTQKLLDDVTEIVMSCVTDENVTSEKREVELEYLGETVECTVYTFTPGAGDISAMLEKLADYLDGNETAIKLYTAAAGYINMSSGIETDEAAIRGDYADIIADLRDNAGTIGESMANAGFTWITAVDGKRVHLESISFSDEYGEPIAISYESYGDSYGERSDVITYYDEWDYIVLANEYELDGKKLDGTLYFSDYYEDIELSYDIDLGQKSSLGLWYGDYEISYYGEPLCKLSVDAAAGGGSDHALDICTYDGSVTATLHSTDKEAGIKAPSTPATDISGYTPEELYAIIEGMGIELENIMYKLYEDMYY